MDILEPGNTVQFTFVSSVAPDSAPTLLIVNSGTVVSSITSASSDSTHYYALYTTPDTEGMFVGKWVAEKTVSGSAYQFKKPFLFNVKETKDVY